MRIGGGTLARPCARAAPAAPPRSVPTSDRVREAIVERPGSTALQASRSPARACSTCSPAPARSSLEALSRGAAHCLFVEEGAEARALIRRNVEAFALTGTTKIFRRDATSLGPAGSQQPFGLAFLDSPYGKGLAERALGLGRRRRLARASAPSASSRSARASRFRSPPNLQSWTAAAGAIRRCCLPATLRRLGLPRRRYEGRGMTQHKSPPLPTTALGLRLA